MVDLFYAMDTDLNGMLDVEEFREAMRKVLLPSLFTNRCFTIISSGLLASCVMRPHTAGV